MKDALLTVTLLSLCWAQQVQHQQPSQMGVAQMGTPQMGVPQMGAPQMGAPQMGAPQMGVPQMTGQQMGVHQVPGQQMGVPQQGYMQQQQQGMVPQQQQYGVAQQGFAQPHQGTVGMPQPGGSFLRDKAQTQDRAHIQEHLSEFLGSNQDLSKMSEEELQFHYFKLHDSDDNNKLDGLELIKSLIHWHVEESKHIQSQQQHGQQHQQQQQQQQQLPPSHHEHGTTKLFSDQELAALIDPILEMDDKNRDGYVDYPEFVAAQKARGF